MRQGYSYWLCIGSATLLLLGVARMGGAWRAAASSARKVTVDGRCYLTEPFAGNKTPFVRRELEQLGVPLPDGFEIARAGNAEHPVYRETLRPSAQLPVAARLPAGLKGEHAIRLETDGQSVELVFGRTAPSPQTGDARLRAEGWTPADHEKNTPGPRVFHLTRGKETAVACLDEADLTFLLIRKVGR